jgi:regulator of protease activity HflC (stomatin/prohibitin superfamily)
MDDRLPWLRRPSGGRLERRPIMAEIKHYPLVAHVRGAASAHQLLWKGGRLRRSGRGLSFWFNPLSANLGEVPLDDRELAFLFHARTADFQEAVCQGVITYRVADPEALAASIDFGLDLDTGLYLETPLDQIADRLTQLSQQHVWGIVNATPLSELMANGVETVRAAIGAGLAGDEGLAEMGLRIVSVRVSSMTPDATVEKALQTPTREAIQQQADEATFNRRALAVEKERAIAENELQNRIELARRQSQLVDQEGLNERRRAEEASAAARIEAEGSADRVRIAAAASAESLHAVEGERVALEKERVVAYGALPPAALLALAAREFAEKIERIEHLNLSPDLLSPFIADLAAAGAARLKDVPAAPAKSGGK